VKQLRNPLVSFKFPLVSMSLSAPHSLLFYAFSTLFQRFSILCFNVVNYDISVPCRTAQILRDTSFPSAPQFLYVLFYQYCTMLFRKVFHVIACSFIRNNSLSGCRNSPGLGHPWRNFWNSQFFGLAQSAFLRHNHPSTLYQSKTSEG
jgi:hypothetical protein